MPRPTSSASSGRHGSPSRQRARGLRAQDGLPVDTLTVPCDGWILPDARASDHSAFWEAGWPAVVITDTAFFRNPTYHRASDRYETLDFGFMAQLGGGLIAAIDATDAYRRG